MSETRVGTVTHYFPKPEVGVIALTGKLEAGETLHFRGATTDFQQEIASMEIDHEKVESAGPGDEVAVKVKQRVRDGDEVFRVEG